MRDDIRRHRPSPVQAILLKFLDSYIAQHGVTPKYDEMLIGIGRNSKGSVTPPLCGLHKKGYITRHKEPGRLRGTIALTEKGLQIARAS